LLKAYKVCSTIGLLGTVDGIVSSNLTAEGLNDDVTEISYSVY